MMCLSILIAYALGAFRKSLRGSCNTVDKKSVSRHSDHRADVHAAAAAADDAPAVGHGAEVSI